MKEIKRCCLANNIYEELFPSKSRNKLNTPIITEKNHKEQKRLSGEQYIVHPVEVAKILVNLKVDRNTVISALLHDILEDTDTPNEVIIEKFGIENILINPIILASVICSSSMFVSSKVSLLAVLIIRSFK